MTTFDDPETQIALIEEYLDELDIPRKSKAGALYSTYGRVSLLGDRYKELLQKWDTLNEDMRIELGIASEE